MSKRFPKEETYSLTDQIRRSSRSVCSCLAEAHRKRLYEAFYFKGYRCVYGKCRNSNLVEFAHACRYINDQEYRELWDMSEQVGNLLNHTYQFVISSIPVITIARRAEPIEVESFGTIAYDTRLISTISARVSGRIERLYVKYRYQHIMKGEKIMDIYSPELLTTERELLFLIKNDPNNSSFIKAARQKLFLQGVSDGQLQQLIGTGKASLTVSVYSNYSGHIHEAGNTMPGQSDGPSRMDISKITEELSVKEGMYVEKGQNIFQVYNVDRSWVLLNIFAEYGALIKAGDPVRVVPETA